MVATCFNIWYALIFSIFFHAFIEDYLCEESVQMLLLSNFSLDACLFLLWGKIFLLHMTTEYLYIVQFPDIVTSFFSRLSWPSSSSSSQTLSSGNSIGNIPSYPSRHMEASFSGTSLYLYRICWNVVLLFFWIRSCKFMIYSKLNICNFWWTY